MAGLLAQGLARFLYTVVIGRLAGPETLGEVNALLSLAVYVSLLWPAPLGLAGSRYIPSASHGGALVDGTIGYLKRLFWISIAVIVPAGVLTGAWLSGDYLTGVAAGILIGTYGGYTFVRGTLLGQDRVLRVTVVDTISSAAALTLLLAVLLLEAPSLLLLPLSLGYLAFSWLGWPRSGRTVLGAALRAEVRRFTAYSVLWMLAAGGLLPITMIFAQLFGTAREAGVFAAAMTLATPANMLAQALSQVLIPFLVARAHESALVRRLVVRLLLLSIAGFTGVFGALFALTPWLLDFFYGAAYADGAFAMQGLLVGVYLISCATVPIAALMATDRQRLVSWVSVVTFALGAAIMAGLAPSMGTGGILTGFIAAPALSLILVTLAVTRRGVTR